MAQIIVRLKDRELQRVPITCVATRVGRDGSNDVVINNDGVSRHHATIRYEPAEGCFVVHDASSANGVFVRGRQTPSARLADGDEVGIGKFTLVFRDGGGAPIEALTPAPDDEMENAARNPLPTMAFRAASKPSVRPVQAVAPGSALSTTPLGAETLAARTTSNPAPAGPTPEQLAADALAAEQARTLRRIITLLIVLVLVMVVLLVVVVLVLVAK